MMPSLLQRLLQSRGLAQIIALLVILAVDRAVSPQFFDLRMQDGRLFGSLIDVLNRGAPVALLALGMVLVIATRGIDLSVGAVMAISGAIAASLAPLRELTDFGSVEDFLQKHYKELTPVEMEKALERIQPVITGVT